MHAIQGETLTWVHTSYMLNLHDFAVSGVVGVPVSLVSHKATKDSNGRVAVTSTVLHA